VKAKTRSLVGLVGAGVSAVAVVLIPLLYPEALVATIVAAACTTAFVFVCLQGMAEIAFGKED